MATVSRDERPAPALAQAALVAPATQALVVEEAGTGAELRVLQGRADVAAETETAAVRRSRGAPSGTAPVVSSHPRPSCLHTTLASPSDQ